LVEGVYFVVNSNHARLFYIIVGNEQHFSVVFDSTTKEMPVIKGSKENDLFKQYNLRSSELDKEVVALINTYNKDNTKQDSFAIAKKIEAKRTAYNNFKNEFLNKNENTLVATFLKVSNLPDVPQNQTQEMQYRFIKEHYWDNMDFTDARFLHTPFFDKKVEDYLKYYVQPNADSIIPEIKFMLLSARESKEIYPYLLIKFTNKYIKPEYMGLDKVFVHLFVNNYLKGDTTYLDAKSRKIIVDRGYFLALNQLGDPAQPLYLTDTTGREVALYNIKSKYTFVAYWSPTCGHCRQEIPILDSIYKSKWRNEGVTVYSILSDEQLMPELHQFINEKKLPQDWIYTYETTAAFDAVKKAGQVNFRQAYDFKQTPVFYLLDVNKKIIGKNLSIDQFDNFISRAKEN
jgi:thiol-disulfide isomerase/thioredoxin